MQKIKLLSILCCALFLLAFQCHTEPVNNGDPVYIEFVSADTLFFDQVYAVDKPVLYHFLEYVYEKEGGISNALSLPLNPFQDTIAYIFRQEMQLDTVVLGYRQEVEYHSNGEKYINAYKDFEILYSTLESVQICESCYLNY